MYGAIHDKVSAHIEAAKEVIAQNLISPDEDDYEEEHQESEEESEE